MAMMEGHVGGLISVMRTCCVMHTITKEPYHENMSHPTAHDHIDPYKVTVDAWHLYAKHAYLALSLALVISRRRQQLCQKYSLYRPSAPNIEMIPSRNAFTLHTVCETRLSSKDKTFCDILRILWVSLRSPNPELMLTFTQLQHPNPNYKA